jgi:hypothetical protein
MDGFCCKSIDSCASSSQHFFHERLKNMAQSTARNSLTDLEREIRAEVRNMPTAHEALYSNHAAPTIAGPGLAMPDYVEHREGATEIGRLSAEAVVREYEATAKEIESMGLQVIERVKECETLSRNALAVIGELNEVAKRYREEAKRVFDHIENCSLLVAEVRRTCTELKDKIAVRGTADLPKSRRK